MKLKYFNNQLSFNYRAPQDTPQGKRLSTYNLDLGMNRDILKGKATVSLRVRDLFNTRKRRSEVIDDNLIQTSEFQWRSRQATLGLVYRLNQKNKPKRRNRSDDFDDDGEF
jgi:hypothetical protein